MKWLAFLLLITGCASADIGRIVSPDIGRVVSFEYTPGVDDTYYLTKIDVKFKEVRNLTMYIYEFDNEIGRFSCILAYQEYILLQGDRLEEDIFTNKPGLFLIIFESAGKEIGRREMVVR